MVQTVKKQIMRSDGIVQTYHVALEDLNTEEIKTKLPQINLSSLNSWIGPLSANKKETLDILKSKQNGIINNKNSFFIISFDNSKAGDVLFEMQPTQMDNMLRNISQDKRQQLYSPNGDSYWIQMKQMGDGGVGLYYADSLDGENEELHTLFTEEQFKNLIDKNVPALSEMAVNEILEEEINKVSEDNLPEETTEIIDVNTVPFHQEHLAYSALPEEEQPSTKKIEINNEANDDEIDEKTNNIPIRTIEAIDFIETIPTDEEISTFAYDADIDKNGNAVKFIPEGINIKTKAQQEAVDILFKPVHIKNQMQNPNLHLKQKLQLRKEYVNSRINANRFRRMARRRLVYDNLKDSSFIAYPKTAKILFAMTDQLGRLNNWRLKRAAAKKWEKRQSIERQKQLWKDAIYREKVKQTTKKASRAQNGIMPPGTAKKGIYKARKFLKI